MDNRGITRAISTITVVFDEAVSVVSPTSIKLRSGSSEIKTFTSGDISVNGNTVAFDVAGSLANSTNYWLEIPSGAIADVASNAFAGLTVSDYSFTTGDGSLTNETPSVVAGVDGLVDFNLPSVAFFFNEEIVVNDLSSFRLYNITDGTTETLTESVFSSNLATNLALSPGKQYEILLDPAAIEDTEGNQYEGIASGDIRFTTTPDYIWNGASWSPSAPPTQVQYITIGGDASLTSSFTTTNLSVTSTGTAVAVQVNITADNLNVENGTSLTIEAGNTFSLQKQANISNSGKFVIADGASLLMDETATFTGNLQVDKQADITANYNFMGSPVTTGNTSSLGSRVYTYDEEQAYGDARWIPASGAMTPGVGYTSYQTGLAEFTGTPNNGDVTVSIKRSNTGVDTEDGWNLVANPYPAAISFAQFIADNSGAIDNSISIWDEGDETSYSNDDYLVYDGTSTVGGNGGSFDGNMNTAQAFFVKKSADGTGNITFNNGMRVAGNNNSLLRVTTEAPYAYVKLGLRSAEGAATTQLVKFRDDFADKKDRNDAFHQRANPSLAFYSVVDNNSFIMNALPETSENLYVQLGLDVAEGEYTFFIDSEHKLAGRRLWLIDEVSGEVTDLRKNDYTITLSTTENNQQFGLLIGQKLELETSEGITGLKVYAAEGKVYVLDGEEQQKTVKIYNLNGQQVFAASAQAANRQIIAPQLPAGLYIVELQTAKGVQSKKIYLD